PTGKIGNVKGTPFDFSRAKTIGEEIDKVQQHTSGYDVTFALRNQSGKLALAAHAYEPSSGREMEVYTTEPGMVFYSGNYLSEKVTGRDGVPYTKNGAFCLETQHFPNSVHNPSFPSTNLRPGEKFHSQTVYKFGVKREGSCAQRSQKGLCLCANGKSIFKLTLSKPFCFRMVPIRQGICFHANDCLIDKMYDTSFLTP